MCKHAFYFTHRRCSDVGVRTSTLFCRTSVCVFDKNTSWGVGCENLHTAQCSRIRQTFWHPTYTCDAISRVRRCIGCANIHMTPCSRIRQTFWHPTYTCDAISRVRRCIGCANIHMTPCRRIQRLSDTLHTPEMISVSLTKIPVLCQIEGLLMLVFVQSNTEIISGVCRVSESRCILLHGVMCIFAHPIHLRTRGILLCPHRY